MKYKVLKECPSVKQPRWLEPGTIFDGTPNSPRIKALLDRGYIEPVPEELKGALRRMAELQERIDKQKAYQILRQDAKGFRPEWKNPHQRKWSASYNHAYGELGAVWDDEDQAVETLYFASEEDLKVSFKKHRKEWLTVFGVEEEK